MQLDGTCPRQSFQNQKRWGQKTVIPTQIRLLDWEHLSAREEIGSVSLYGMIQEKIGLLNRAKRICLGVSVAFSKYDNRIPSETELCLLNASADKAQAASARRGIMR